MHQVPYDHVLDLRAATDTSKETGFIGPDKYMENRKHLARHEMPDVFYLFSLPEGWDVLEVTKERARWPILRKGDDDLHLGKIDPAEHGTVIRTLILTPVNAEAETRALLGLPRWDRYIRITGVLTDDDRYLPLSAEYIGAHDRPIDAAKIVADTLAILSSGEFKVQVELPAPILPDSESIAQWRRELRTGPMPQHRRQQLVAELMAMDGEAFIEAISWLVPVIDKENSWLDSHHQLGDRVWKWSQERPEQGRNFTNAPWKTGRMLPRHYNPRVGFHTPEPVSPQPISI